MPLAQRDAALDAALLAEFDAVLRAELTADERTMLDGVTVTPRFDVVVEGDELLLRLTYYGGSTWIGWDGTRDDAFDVVRGMARAAAGNLSGDHWQQFDGWRSSPYAGGADADHPDR